MQPSSHGKCNDTLNETRHSNKATFHKETVFLILKDKHTVKTNKWDAKEEITVVEGYAANDGLRSQQSGKRIYSREGRHREGAGHDRTQPRHRLGKLRPQSIKPGTQGPSDIKAIKNLGCTVDWPLFIFDTKPAQTAILHARNQAQCDCGAVLKSLLKLKEYVEGRGSKKKTGAVEDFWVFSLCWNPKYANILVHCFESMDEETEIFQVTKLLQKFMDDEEGQAALHTYGQNAFGHGFFTHVPAME